MQTNQVVVLILGGIACVCDVRTRRIPNLLTFGGAALGVVYWVVVSGLSGAVTSIGGWMTGAVLFLPMFALGGMGAGDVKLAACLGAWRRPVQTVEVAHTYVVAASRTRPVGARLTPADVKLIAWPVRTVVPGAFAKLEAVLNRCIVAQVLENEPVTKSKLAPVGSGAGLP